MTDSTLDLDPCEQSAIVPTGEVPADEKRHPWTCRWRIPGLGQCHQVNKARDSHCVKCGRPYATDEHPRVEPGTGIMERPTMRESVEEYQRHAARVRELFAELHGIEERLTTLFCSEHSSISLHTSLHGRPAQFTEVDEVLGLAERYIWGEIVARSGIHKICSAQRWNELSRQLGRGDVPPLTPENVEATLSTAVGNVDEIFREKVTEVFDWLRPHNDRYKSNSPFEIGKHVILEGMLEPAKPQWTWRPRVAYGWEGHKKQMLTSMESLFKALDGKGQQTTSHQSDIEMAIAKTDPENAVGSTEFFEFRCHRNGSLRIKFARPDLVAKLNAIAGGKNLKGARKGRAA